MREFLASVGVVVLLTVALGLLRVAWGPGRFEPMMAAQLLGSGAIGALLLFGAATGESAMVDIALTLALVSAFAAIAFVKSGAREHPPAPDDEVGR